MFAPLDDLDIMINPDEWACEALLWPGGAEERTIHAIWSQPTELVDVGGGEVGRIALAPALLAKSSDVEGARQGDAVRVMPCPRLGLTGGDYRIKKQIHDGRGLSTLELSR